MRCKMCNVRIVNEKCVFATYKRFIDGKEYYFCCEKHADAYEREQSGQKNQ